MLDVNARSMLVTTQVAARAMIAAGRGGRIVNIASMAAKRAGGRAGPLRGVQGRRRRADPGRRRRARAARHHRQRHLSRLRAHRDGRGDAHARDGRRVERHVAARSLRRAGRRRPHGPVPGVRRRLLLHRPGVQRHRWHDHALRTTVTTETDRTTPAGAHRTPRCSSSPTSPRRSPTARTPSPARPSPSRPASSSPSSGRRAAASRRCCASPPGLDAPTTGTVAVDRRSLGYVFQDATLLQWRTVRRNVELFAELEGMRQGRARPPRRRQRPLVGLDGFEDKYPKQLSGGMQMRASLARSLLMEPDDLPVRRAVRRPRRDHPRAPQRRAAGAVPAQGLRRPVHHPLDLRGRVPVDAGARDVGPPGTHHRRRSTCRSPTPARPTCASSRRSPSCAARSATPCGERTHERRRQRRPHDVTSSTRGADVTSTTPCRRAIADARRRDGPPALDRHRRAGDRASSCSSASGG